MHYTESKLIANINMVVNRLYAKYSAGITDLKKDPMGTVAAANGQPVLILNRNEPAFYCVPAETFEEIMRQAETGKKAEK